MSAILHYFDGRGKAEIIRLTLAATGVEFVQKSLTESEQFDKLKRENYLLFNQLPLVEFEGKNMVQSSATSRFFARKGNLLGDTPDEMLQIDILFEGTRDFLNFFMKYGFEPYQQVVDSAKSTGLPKYLPVFEKVLKQNGSTGYLVGNKLSLADIGLIENILLVEELIGADALKDYPEIQKFSTTIKSLPKIAAYLSGPQRPRKNDDRYVQEVKTVLKW